MRNKCVREKMAKRGSAQLIEHTGLIQRKNLKHARNLKTRNSLRVPHVRSISKDGIGGATGQSKESTRDCHKYAYVSLLSFLGHK